MTATTEERWSQRVRTWRASGETADAFAHGKGYAGSTLRWWASRLGRGETSGFVRLVPKAPDGHHEAALVVEVGRARVHVKAGFDTKLLAEVVAALGGDR